MLGLSKGRLDYAQIKSKIHYTILEQTRVEAMIPSRDEQLKQLEEDFAVGPYPALMKAVFLAGWRAADKLERDEVKGLVEACKRLNRVKAAAIFAVEPQHIEAMFHELTEALAAYEAAVKRESK